MFFRILKKELKQKKGINIILFLFMMLATIFVASSVNNILVVSNATDYCMKKGKVPDKYIAAFEMEGDKHLDEWLDTCSLVKDYTKEEDIVLSQNNIVSFKGEKGADYKIKNTIMLQSQWKKYMQIFDVQGNPVQIKDGEIGMQRQEMENNHLKLGDTITIQIGNVTKKLILSQVIMDPAFGGDYIGMTRYLISEKDYKEYKNTGTTVFYNYCVNTDHQKQFTSEMNRQVFSIIIAIDRNMFAFTYVMSMIIAGILILIGLCLIVIAFLILRFTIIFTLQEDYKEIGIMKAIGIRNFTIKKIYLVKYFMLVAFAASIGCVISVPVSNAMLKSVSRNMLMENGSANIGMNILSAILVMIVVLLLCYLCTNRLKKYSAIDAIRSGQSGERFHKKSWFALYKNKRMNTPVFLAMNDIFSNLRRYLVLIITFAMGTLVIILPLNAITTLGSTEMAKNFLLDTNSDFYINPDNLKEDVTTKLGTENATRHIEEIVQVMKSGGYDVTLQTSMFYTLSYYVDDSQDINQIFTLQPLNNDGTYIELTDGVFPALDNEIAISENEMKKLNLKIGDTVHLLLKGTAKDMIITGTYQNFLQMGESAIINSKFDLSAITASGYWYYQGKVNHITDKKDLLKRLKTQFPQYEFLDIKQVLKDQLGSTVTQLDQLKLMIVVLICGINFLITLLMMKIFHMSEKGQTAMLRSIGFSIRTVRIWQVLRMGIVLFIGVVLGGVLSIFLNNLVNRPIFGLMGATHMQIQVNPLEAYLMYPLLLLLVINLAAVIGSASVKKLNLMEINNIE